MHPVLLKIGPITIHTYGFMFALGVLSAIIISTKFAKKENIDLKLFSNMVFYTVLIGLVGAKLLLFLTNFNYYIANPGQLKYLLTSGGTFFGGLIFGIFYAVWYMRKYKIDTMTVADFMVPSIALAHFFGRLGCFFAGCCWGRDAAFSPMGIKFTSSYAHEFTGIPIHTAIYPVQLIESVLNFLNFIVLLLLYKKKRFRGQIFTMYLFNYSLIRFFTEYLRGDSDRNYLFGGIDQPLASLSLAQLISIIGLISSIILYKKFKKANIKQYLN